MDEIVLTLLVSVAALAGTGVLAVFKGRQIRQWLRQKEKSVRAAHRANTVVTGNARAHPRARP